MPQTISNITTPQSKRPNRRSIALSRFKRKLLGHVWLVRAGILTLVILGLYLTFLLFGRLFSNLGVGNFSGLVYSFLSTPESQIASLSGRTNLVIMGKGGEGHTAGDLTDTIIFVSVSHTKPGVTLISLPRDIWVPAIRAKLNSAYYWGNQKQPASSAGGPGGGLVLAKSEVEQIVGMPVHYAVVVDFTAFTKVIDVLGGIELNVERGFIDEKYPIPGHENDKCGGDPEFKCRYEIVKFNAGPQMMDGETALKFVRSRNAEGDEGTDIAREARQQKVIVAIKDKILSPSILLNPKRAFAIWKVVSDSVETDISGNAGVILARRLISSRRSFGLYVLPQDLLENPPISSRYDNQYVFIPSGDNWKEVQAWIKENIR